MSADGVQGDKDRFSDLVKDWAASESLDPTKTGHELYVGLANETGRISAKKVDDFLSTEVANSDIAAAQRNLRDLLAENHCQIVKVGDNKFRAQFAATRGGTDQAVDSQTEKIASRSMSTGSTTGGTDQAVVSQTGNFASRSMSMSSTTDVSEMSVEDSSSGVVRAERPKVDPEIAASLNDLDPESARGSLINGMSDEESASFHCSVLYHMSAGVTLESPKGQGVADPSFKSDNPEIEKKAIAFVAKCEEGLDGPEVDSKDFGRMQGKCLQAAKNAIGTESNRAMCMQFKLQTLGGANTFQTGKDLYGFVGKTNVGKEGGATFAPAEEGTPSYVSQGYQAARSLEALIKNLYPPGHSMRGIAEEALDAISAQKKIEFSGDGGEKWTNEDVSRFLLNTFGPDSDIFVAARLANQDMMQAASGFMVMPQHLGVSGDSDDRTNDDVAYYSGGYPKSHTIDISVSEDGGQVTVTQSLEWEEGVYKEGNASGEKVEVRTGKEKTRSTLRQTVTYTYDTNTKEVGAAYNVELGLPSRKKDRHQAIQNRINVVMS